MKNLHQPVNHYRYDLALVLLLSVLVFLSSSCSVGTPVKMDDKKTSLVTEKSPDSLGITTTITPSIPPTATVIPTGTPSATLEPTPTQISTPVRCNTPMSLMLHSDFGAKRMEELVEVIKKNNLITITYQDLYEEYFFQGKCPPKEALLVSLDDPKPSDFLPVFKDMIQVFVDNNMVLSISLITREPHDPENWAYLNDIQEKGFELSSHTVNHQDLLKLDADEIQFELEESYNHICENTGKCPFTLVLPMGNGSEDADVLRIAREVGYLGIVSVSKGEIYFGGELPHIFKRAFPNMESQDETLANLRLVFQNW